MTEHLDVPATGPAPVARSSVHRRNGARRRVTAWREQHAHSFLSSLARLGARPWATALTVLVMAVALALPLLLHVLINNAQSLSSGLREAREITVFLKPGADIQQSKAFVAELQRDAQVLDTVLRTPEQGLAEFRQLSGFANALDLLTDNPLPVVLVITPRVNEGEGEGEQTLRLLTQLKADARVDMVQYDATWRQRLGAILGFGERVVHALMALLAVATLLIVGNTVRMDIQGRAEEIAVMQLIGAGNGFVRRPFLYAGLWYGILGGVCAVLVVAAIELALRAPLHQLLSSYANRFTLHGFSARDALVVILASATLGWLGAWIVTTRYLFAGRPQD